MKRLLSLIFVLLVMFSVLTACSKTPAETTPEKDPIQSEIQDSTEESDKEKQEAEIQNSEQTTDVGITAGESTEAIPVDTESNVNTNQTSPTTNVASVDQKTEETNIPVIKEVEPEPIDAEKQDTVPDESNAANQNQSETATEPSEPVNNTQEESSVSNIKYNLKYETQNQDDYKVYGLSKEQNGDTIKFTLDFEAPQGSRVYAFNPPNGDSFKSDFLKASGEREKISFEIPSDTYNSIESITISISKTGTDDDRCFVFIKENASSSEMVTYAAPELTQGNALDYPKEINYYSSSAQKTLDFTVYSVTSQKLDNGYIRIKISYKAENDSRLLASYSGDGSKIGYSELSTGSTQTFTFDCRESDVSSYEAVVIRAFNNNGGNNSVFSRGEDILQQNPQKGSDSEVSKNTNGKTEGDAWSIPYVMAPQKQNYEVYSLTGQKLNNGYVRITLDFKAPKGLKILTYDQPNGAHFNYYGIVTTGERQTYVVDLFQSDIKQCQLIEINIFSVKNPSNSVLVEMKSADVLAGL